MTVRALLKDKGEQVSTIRPDVKVGEIMDQLERDEVSALVVSKDGRTILGIVSGGDVMRGLKRDGPAIVEKTVEEVMTSEVVTCNVGEPLATVYELMDANRIRHVPIVDNGDLCGLINTLDVVKHRLGELELEAEALKGYVAGRA